MNSVTLPALKKGPFLQAPLIRHCSERAPAIKVHARQRWIYDDADPEHPFYFNRSWIMLLTDLMLEKDPAFKEIAEEYALDEDKWKADFASAFKRYLLK